MPNPTFEIHISHHPSKSTIKCNGIDISSAIRSVKIGQVGGNLPTLSLEVIPTRFTADLEAQLEVVWNSEMTLGTRIPDSSDR